MSSSRPVCDDIAPPPGQAGRSGAAGFNGLSQGPPLKNRSSWSEEPAGSGCRSRSGRPPGARAGR